MKDPYIEYPICKFKVDDKVKNKDHFLKEDFKKISKYGELVISSINPITDDVLINVGNFFMLQFTLSEVNENFIKA